MRAVPFRLSLMLLPLLLACRVSPDRSVEPTFRLVLCLCVGSDGQVVVRWGGLVFVERDDDDAGRAGHVPFHELVHTRGRIVIKRGRGLIVTSSSVVVIAWCDVLVPVVQPYTHVGDAGSVPYAGGGPIAGDRADRDDAAVAVALARMALVETGDAPAVRVGPARRRPCRTSRPSSRLRWPWRGSRC